MFKETFCASLPSVQSKKKQNVLNLAL